MKSRLISFISKHIFKNDMQVLEDQIHQPFAGFWSHEVYKTAKELIFTIYNSQESSSG